MFGPKKKMLVWSWPPAPGRAVPPAPDGKEIMAEPEAPEEKAVVKPEVSAPEITAPAAADPPAAPVAAEEPKTAAAEFSGAGSPAAPLKADRPFPAKKPCQPPVSPMPPTGPAYPGMELARAYVPVQRYGPTYSPAEALQRGTLFPDLYRPYPY